MSLNYRAVQWSRQKRVYDLLLGGGVLLFFALFLGIGFATHPNATVETQLIRASGTGAFVLLHGILCIGPLCRLDPRFLPLLYNRRHLGVTMFALAALHGAITTIQFHAFGDLNPLVSILVSNTHLDRVSEFPFQPLGLAALVILFLMAATSHDYWLANLSAPVWKALHMGVYAAYLLLVAHVALGVLQSEGSLLFPLLLAMGVSLVTLLHVAAALKEAGSDRTGAATERAAGVEWIDVGLATEIPDGRAKIVNAGGERVAVFRDGDQISALSNVCQHQNGPLGEGKIVDGCVTCPWHGFQYFADSGRSPEPFEERIPTFRTRIESGRVWLDPRPLAAGTAVPASVLGSEGSP